MDVWFCRACLDGRHFDCDEMRGCECGIRLGPEGWGLVLCEALTGGLTLVVRPDPDGSDESDCGSAPLSKGDDDD